jgi:hypothetical protein
MYVLQRDIFVCLVCQIYKSYPPTPVPATPAWLQAPGERKKESKRLSAWVQDQGGKTLHHGDQMFRSTGRPSKD